MDLTPLAPVLASLITGLFVLAYISWTKPKPKRKTVDYRRYLSSSQWRQKRQVALHHAGRRCRVCGAGERLEVHHNTYDRLGHESLGDLLVMCKDCHELFTKFGRLKR